MFPLKCFCFTYSKTELHSLILSEVYVQSTMHLYIVKCKIIFHHQWNMKDVVLLGNLFLIL